ncbi:MAG: phosphoglycerate kinase [Thermoplasmata archaeon]|nr:MAG: phosphoglycerate kinase [Thermoplasmata archaeon]
MLPTMDDFDFRGKTVIVRVDINSPLDPKTLKILDNWRIKRIVPTLKELKEKEAKQIILAHQGRPGKWDFTSLKRHAEELEKVLGEKINFVDDVYGEKAIQSIKNMDKGEILLLDNVRKCSEEMEKKSAEEHSKAEMVQKLSPFANAFVNDAFAAAHRAQCSLIGFIPVLPSFAGRLLQEEVEMVQKLLRQAERPRLFIFGGAKYQNAMEVMGSLLEKGIADKIIAGGMPGNAFLAVLGKMDMEVEPAVKELWQKHKEKIITPVDTIDGKDIGNESIKLFKEEIEKASSIFISGPMGMFEEEAYKRGTEEILRAIASSSAFSMAGGGHTAAAIRMLGLEKDFSYISTGGGALEKFLMGKSLPVIDALIKFKRA